MKKFQFNSKQSVIKGIEETPVKKGINWDRIIYFAALAIVLFSFGSFFIGKYLVVKAESEIIIHKFDVNFPEDVIVNEYYVEEDDTVKAGDLLFNYRLGQHDDGDGNGGIVANVGRGNDYSNSTYNWLIREKISTEQDIKFAQLEIRKEKKELAALTSGLDRLKKEVFLDIYPPAKLQEVQDKVENAKMNISAEQSRIYSLKEYLTEIERRIAAEAAKKNMDPNEEAIQNIAALGGANGSGAAFNPMNIPYYAPQGGMVSQIYAYPNETTYESQLIMDMVELKDIHIKAYFHQEALNYIDEGDIVDITFPDGSKSKGVIDQIYLKTTNLPDRLYETGSELERRVRVIVIPLKIDETDKWFKFYKISVTVSKSKYF